MSDFPEVLQILFSNRSHTVEAVTKKEICFPVNILKYVRLAIFQNNECFQLSWKFHEDKRFSSGNTFYVERSVIWDVRFSGIGL